MRCRRAWAVCVEDAASLEAMGTQLTESKSLSNRKPETMGSGEAPHSMSVVTTAQDAAEMGSNCGSRLGREAKRVEMPVTWYIPVQNTSSY